MADQQFFGPIPLPPILSEIDKPHKWYLGEQLAKSAGAQANVDQYVQDFARGNGPRDIFNKQKKGISQMYAAQFEAETQGEIQKVAGGYKNPKDVPDPATFEDPASFGGLAENQSQDDGMETGPWIADKVSRGEPVGIQDVLNRMNQARSQAPQYQEPSAPKLNGIALLISALGAAANPRQAQEILAQPFVGALMQRNEKAAEAQRRYVQAKEAHDGSLEQLKIELQNAVREQGRTDDEARYQQGQKDILGREQRGDAREDAREQRGVARDEARDARATAALQQRWDREDLEKTEKGKQESEAARVKLSQDFGKLDPTVQAAYAKDETSIYYGLNPRTVLTPDEKLKNESLKKTELMNRFLPEKLQQERDARQKAIDKPVSAGRGGGGGSRGGSSTTSAGGGRPLTASAYGDIKGKEIKLKAENRGLRTLHAQLRKLYDETRKGKRPGDTVPGWVDKNSKTGTYAELYQFLIQTASEIADNDMTIKEYVAMRGGK